MDLAPMRKTLLTTAKWLSCTKSFMRQASCGNFKGTMGDELI